MFKVFNNTKKYSLLNIHILFFIINIILTYPLWFSKQPVLSLSIVDSLALFLFFSIFLLTSLMLYFFVENKKKILLFIIIALAGALFSNFLLVQPWNLYFLSVFFFLYVDKPQYIKYIVSSVYMISGIQKINPFFLEETIPYLFPFVSNVNMLLFIGLFLVLFEVFVPVILLKKVFTNNKINALLFGLLNLGILIVAFIDPNIHLSVISWIICLSTTGLFILINKNKQNIVYANIYTYIVVLFFYVLPLLGYFGLYPSYLSSKIYSGNTNLAVVKASNTYDIGLVSGKYLDLWFFEKYSMYPPPQIYVYQHVIDQLCQKNTVSSNFSIVVFEREGWIFNKNKKRELYCEYN